MPHTQANTTTHREITPPHLYKTLFATCIGNAMEWFDIAIYAFFAVYIAHNFFPATNETISLMVTFGTFGISFLVRPIGAIVLGAYADRAGRKASLLVSIGLMMLGCLMIAIMPTYQSIGIAAPLLIILARLIQGFSAGGEFGSSTAFLVEHFPERKSFIASWQFATQGISTLLASAFGFGLAEWLTESELQEWGWRIPFFFGLLIGPVGLYIRRHLHEPPSFRATNYRPVNVIFLQQKKAVLIAVGLMVISTAVNYMLNYIPAYAAKSLHLPTSAGFAATLLGGTILAVMTPLVGLWSERIGRTPLMTGSLVLLITTVYPSFYLLMHNISTSSLIIMVAWLALLKSLYFAMVPSMMADLFPSQTRATGMSLSYNIAVTLFGGFTPFISTLLINRTGSAISPSYYLIAVAFLSMAALYSALHQPHYISQQEEEFEEDPRG